MRRRGFGIRSSVVFEAALILVVGVVFGAAQTAAARQQATAKPATSSPSGNLQTSASPVPGSPSTTRSSGSNSAVKPQSVAEDDATREDLANFDRFLDTHPVLERELGSNPSLVNDPTYVQREPDLRIFLSHHPAVKAHLERDPQYLARRMDFADANAGPAGSSSDPSLDQAEASDMREFLRSHDNIRQLLAENPALIDDSTFLSSHEVLKAFLTEHPRAQSVFAQNPRYFISPAEGPVAAAPPPKRQPAAAVPSATKQGGEPVFTFGITPENIGRMDQFLEDHPQIQKDLKKHPTLVTNHSYLEHHRELRRFFDEHVRVRNAFAEDPRYFVPRNGFGARPPMLEITSQATLTGADLDTTASFLRKHKDTAAELQKNPIIVQDLHYLQNHDDLRKFFDQHPRIQTEFDEHPRYFMHREEPVLQKAIAAEKGHK